MFLIVLVLYMIIAKNIKWSDCVGGCGSLCHGVCRHVSQAQFILFQHLPCNDHGGSGAAVKQLRLKHVFQTKSRPAWHQDREHSKQIPMRSKSYYPYSIGVPWDLIVSWREELPLQMRTPVPRSVLDGICRWALCMGLVCA